MSKEELIAELEEMLEIDEGTLMESTVLEDIEEWDSLAKLSLVALAKKELSVTLTASKIKEFVTVEDICKELL